MKGHRKSSQRQKPAERRERKRKPRETPFPLPPCPKMQMGIDSKYASLLRDLIGIVGSLPERDIRVRTTCMMERETWA